MVDFSQLGAQFIHQTNHAVYRFAKKHDLVVDEREFAGNLEEEFYFKDGSEVPEADIARAWVLMERYFENVIEEEIGRYSVGHQLLAKINSARSLSNGTKFVLQYLYKDPQ